MKKSTETQGLNVKGFALYLNDVLFAESISRAAIIKEYNGLIEDGEAKENIRLDETFINQNEWNNAMKNAFVK